MTAEPEAGLIMPPPAPRRGEEIRIIRPGAPDIRMRFERVDREAGWNPAPGWLLLFGEILEGLINTGGWRWRTLCARPIERGVYQMVGVKPQHR
ncbi:hypothetical protein Ait01nite_089220 [Actinoplanes italicus]|uniref:Uncharacterized protein n=1 Tax=Actinoplanes italicus TaxID=113567 RepID=A0A2T0JIC8_9ACTN|nr:hypothetical protein [Actinoplanes italicus]PRX07338.1 hypothetical protein CLV67_14213 [Actinoplanes italicus]GIE35877.1 hypothetical protein Ait01nite_089220 [Actinoplanes italicus]